MESVQPGAGPLGSPSARVGADSVSAAAIRSLTRPRTASAAVHLLEKIGAKILEVHFLVELEFLQGRKKLKGYPVKSLVTY